MNDYKQDIINTRKGCLGSSDATMLAKIASLGYVPETAYKRLAVCKGIGIQEEISSAAMRYGDYIEQQIFAYLQEVDSRVQSNPLWISDKYSRANVKCIDHVDFLLQDDNKQALYVYECKASSYPTSKVRHLYDAQLYHHQCFAREFAAKLGAKYKPHVMLVHYDTSGLDLRGEFTFDPDRITIKEVRYNTPVFNLAHGMDIVSKFLETWDGYSELEVVEPSSLPSSIQSQMTLIADTLREIKEREIAVEEFKARLYDFLTEHGVKKVACDDFSISVVAPTETASVDYKKLFTEEIEAKKPRAATRLKEKYKKITNRKGFVTIKLNNNH